MALDLILALVKPDRVSSPQADTLGAVVEMIHTATLQTGLVVQVPLFVNIGDVITVDTRSGLERRNSARTRAISSGTENGLTT